MTFGMVLVTLIGAFFGALFGYILGLIVELFPGMGGLGLPALLAAAGLLAGAALGVLVSLWAVFVGRVAFKKSMRRWSHEFGHGFGHRFGHSFRHHARWGHYWYDGCAGEFGAGSHTVEDTLQEMDGYLSYLEDLPKEKVASYGDSIGRLSERMGRLRESLRQ